ncbi:general transcription factor II-I repeat domain-containing protein 2-like [Hydra vulgaris]|uniref:General transcription factor II-I repeat domain-containing protein 2-like n=1 Tax=Hydra vulgaris TaxID=6087 RepID=A0ABM4BNL0_HYDVU
MSHSKSNVSRKRIIENEKRIFQSKWEVLYHFKSIKETIICLICQQKVSVPKEFNIKRHYKTHQEKFEVYQKDKRTDKLKELKVKLKRQQNIFHSVNQSNELVVKANYNLAHLIAFHSEPFTEGEFIKNCLFETAKILCPEKIKDFNNISLLRNTIAERSKRTKLSSVLLLNENGIEYEDLPYYTEVRWLCHKVLEAFNYLKTEILQFLATKGQDISDIKNNKFLPDLAFLVDITKHLNDLKIISQGKNKLVTTMFDNLRAFQTKLLLWEHQIEQENLVHFETCKSIKLQGPNFMFSSYLKNINNIKQDFGVRFQTLVHKCKPKFALFTSPFNFDIEKVEEDLQMELIEL